MALIDDIKARYPSPTSARGANPYSEYCVGGALCLYNMEHNQPPHFPRLIPLGRRLEALNPALPTDLAFAYAKLIASANDERRFDSAWHIAQQALEYVPQEEVQS